MTYLENKKILFSLIDEKNPNNQYFTDDEDARIKCANLYASRYQELADIKMERKLKEYEITETGEGYTQFKLPNCKQIRNVVGMDANNNKKSIDFYYLGKFIYINNREKSRAVVEYEPYPSVITDETPDDFELEIDQDLQAILPFGVAADLFKTDPGEDYKAFEREYERRLQNIVTSKFGMSVNVTKGEI